MYLEDLKETKILAGGGDFNTTTTVGDPGISWSVTEGMVGGNFITTRPPPDNSPSPFFLFLCSVAHGETSVSIREYRNLRTQYKKLEKNYSSLSSAYEVGTVLVLVAMCSAKFIISLV